MTAHSVDNMSGNMVRPKHISQVWSPDNAIRPCLLSVTRSICKAGYHGRHETLEWTLDYSCTPFGGYRVGVESAAWKERRAFEAHLYRPRTIYWEDTSSAGVASTCGIFISFRDGDNVLSPALTRQQCACFSDPARRLGRLLERLLEIGLRMGANGFADAQAMLWEVVSLLNAAESKNNELRVIPAEDKALPVSDFLQTVLAYFHEHLSEHVAREDLARHLKISVSALAHRYHAEAGETLTATLTRMRIHAAKSLLLKGDPLKLVADQTGFYDEFHLSRIFKCIEGVSPRDFRLRQKRRHAPFKLMLP